MKQKLNLRSRTSVFWQLFKTSLLPALCTVLILSAVLIPMMVLTAKENDEAYGANLLYTTKDRLDRLLESAEQYDDKLLAEEWLQRIYIDHHIQQLPLHADLKRDVIRGMGVWTAKEPDLAQISFQFFGAENEVYTGVGVCTNLEYYRELPGDNLLYQFYQEPQGLSTVEYGDREYLLFCIPFRNIADAPDKGLINLFYPSETLSQSLLLRTSGEAVGFRILDTEGNVLWAYDNPLSRERVHTLRDTASVGDYQYEIDVPLSVFYRTRNRIQPFLWIVVLADLLICCVFAMFCARSNYRPIDDMIHKYAGSIVDGNEYQLLDQMMHNLRAEATRSRSSLDKLKPLVRKNMLGSLLDGTVYSSEKFDDQLQTCDLQFAYPQYTAMALHIPFSQQMDSAALESEQGALLLVERLLEQAGQGLKIASYVYQDGMNRYRVLVNFSDTDDLSVWLGRVETGLAQLLHVGETELPWHIGVGSTMEHSSGIYRSADQAEMALNYSTVDDSTSMLYYEDIEAQICNQYTYLFTTQLLFSRTIQEGDQASALELLEEIIAENQRKHLSQPTVQALYNDLVSTVHRSVQSAGLSSGDLYAKRPQPAALAEVHQRVAQMVSDACAGINLRQPETDYADVDQQILDYVDQNLYNAALSLNAIAEQFQRSTSYISKIFKRKKDLNYNEYINRARIQRAVELMAEGNNNLSDVCERVGYVSMTTFRRNFIKYTNQIPSDLRN